jgi:hypothetical protein
MNKDLHGLTLSTDSAEAVAAFDRATMSYLKYRTDAGRQLGGALKADPDFALAYVLRGYFNMLAYNQANVAGAQESLAEARKRAKRTTTREAAHIEALARWVEGDLDRMLDVWEGIFAEHPHDVLAFRLHHFNAFWLGRPIRPRCSCRPPRGRSSGTTAPCPSPADRSASAGTRARPRPASPPAGRARRH